MIICELRLERRTAPIRNLVHHVIPWCAHVALIPLLFVLFSWHVGFGLRSVVWSSIEEVSVSIHRDHDRATDMGIIH